LAPGKKGPSIKSADKALEAARLASDKKASDVAVLDMSGLAPFTDYFVICSGESTQQVRAIVENVEEGLAARKLRPIGVEGKAHLHWVLMDYGDVVVHVFERETRQFYGLEKLWLDAPRVEFDEGTPLLGRKDKRKVSG
jgi:ribosome-associated protein